MIVDYSLARPPMSVLHALGVTGVIRYLGWDGQPGFQDTGKNLSVAEKDQLLGSGFQVGLTFEYAADAAGRGTTQGRADGDLATRQVADLGLVDADDPMGVFYAVDYNIPDFAPSLPETPANARAKLGPIGDYFQAIHDTRPNHQVNAYGDYYAIKRLLACGLVKMGWQTIAWSGGQWDPESKVVLRQLVQQVFGADVDLLEATGPHPDWGQWPRPGSPPPPPPPPPPSLTPITVDVPTLVENASGVWVRRTQALCNAAGHALTLDGAFGAKTLVAVRAVQTAGHIQVDGEVGPHTWKVLITGEDK